MRITSLAVAESIKFKDICESCPSINSTFFPKCCVCETVQKVSCEIALHLCSYLRPWVTYAGDGKTFSKKTIGGKAILAELTAQLMVIGSFPKILSLIKSFSSM